MVPGFRAHFQYSGGLELDASLIQQNIDMLQRQRPVDVRHNTEEYYVMIQYAGFNISHFSTIIEQLLNRMEFVISKFSYFFYLEKRWLVCFKKEVFVNKHIAAKTS